MKIAVQIEDTLAPGGNDFLTVATLPDPYPGAKEFLDRLKKDGHEVILLTTRAIKRNLSQAIHVWAVRNGFNFDEVWVCDGLPMCDLIVSTRALQATDDLSKLGDRVAARLKVRK